MASPDQILEMIRSTGLKPYLDAIQGDASKAQFASVLLHNLPALYKRQGDGRVLFPFKRLFMTAGKS